MRVVWPAAIAGTLALGCMTNTGRRAWNLQRGDVEVVAGVHAQAAGLEPGRQAVAATASGAYGLTDGLEVGAALEVDAFYSMGGDLAGRGIMPWGVARLWVKQNVWANEDSSRVASVLVTGSYHLFAPSGELALLFGTRLTDRVELTLSPRLLVFGPPMVFPGASAAIGVRVGDKLMVMPEVAVLAPMHDSSASAMPPIQLGVSFVRLP